MLIVHDEEHLQAVREFADQIGLRQQLEEQLSYLENKTGRCHLYKDFAPYSFEFEWQIQNEAGEWKAWLTGGLIFQSKEIPADGSAPSFTVSLNNDTGWFIHT